MAIVLVIIGFLLGGLLVSLSAQIDMRNYNETKQKIAVIKEAVVGFTLANGRLPCPADPTVASGTAGAGTQKFDVAGTSCNSLEGVVPWVDLGVLETDAWGRRFTYRVTNSFSDAFALSTVSPPVSCVSVPSSSSFALCSEGDLTISDGAVSIAIRIPAVVVSHGKNGFGAYNSDGTKISDISASSQEKENSDADADFVSMIANPATYDDVVDWVSQNTLFNRMVMTGKLP
ncbi:MAG: prepilin-type cleavage/methylation domain-containing protein [Methylotenera sp.]